MADKTTVQITKDNIEQFDIRIGTIIKDNEGMYWRITDFNDFSAGMRVCDKDGNEIENFVGNAGRSVFGGGLSDLLNDGVTTYFIETKQPEIKKDVRYNYFVKDTAEFEQFAKFEPITNLTAEEAVSKFYELQKKGFSSGIGINIPNDIVFDDSKGIGSTIVVIDEEKKANFSIFGDSFIKNVNIETKSDTLKTRISAYEELYNKLTEQNIPTEYPQFVFEKKAELEKKLDSQNYVMHDETVSTSEIEEEKLSIQKTIQQLKDELNNPDVNNPADDQYISETKEYIERLENMTDEDFKNIAAEKKEQQKKNEETHRRVVERMAAEKLSREIPQEGELLSYNETHPTYSVVNKETNRQTAIQPRGRLEENVRRLGRLSTLAEARNAVERIKSSGFEILSTESRVVIFNEDKFYDFDSVLSYFNYTTNKFEHNSDARALNDWDFKDYIKGGLKITKRMKAFEKIGSKTAGQENENKLNEAEIADKEENPQVIYFNDLSPEQKEEVINGYRSADDQDMLTEWENVLRKNLTQIKKDNPFIPSFDIEKETSVAANPPSDEWISEYLQKNKVNFNTDFWQDIFAEMEAKPELKTYHTLKESDVKDLEIVSDEEFSGIVDSIILNDYKNIPNAIRLPNLNAELSEKLGLEKNSAFILKKSSAHIRPDRKGSYEQALDTEEYREIPQVMRDATFALVDNRVKNFQILFDDKNDIKKINKIVFNKDELGNYLVTVGKVDRRDGISEIDNSVVGVGVAPTISALRFPEEQPATRLRPSPTTDGLNIAHESEKSSFRTFYEEMNKKPYASLGRYMPTDDELKDYERRQDIKSWDSNEMSEMADYARSQISIGDDSWQPSYMLYLIQNESAKRGFKITKKMKEFEKIGATKENVNKNIEIITSVQGFANLKFSEKPTEEIRNILRENGWYYSRNNNVWYPSVKSKQRTAELSNQFAEKLIQQFAEKPLEEQLDEYIEQMAANGGMSEETISMLAEEDEIHREELYEEEMQDKAEREEEHSEINVDELKNELKSALHEVAEPLIEIDFTRENYQALFPRYRIETPLESAKLGANQFEKLEAKDRQKLLSAVYSTLKTPDLIVDEKKTEIDKLFGDEVEKESHIYAKSFVIEGKEKAVQSVVVSIDDDNVSISTHERDINNIVNKIKTPDQLLYVATAVRRMAEQHTQNEQSVVSPNRVHNFVDIVTSPNPNYNENNIKSISDLIAEGNITNRAVENPEVSIKLSGNNIEIPVEEKATVEALPEIMTEREPDFESIREYEKNHENNTAQNLTESETRRNIMEESLQENDVLEEQNYGRTGENFSNGTGNLRTEHQILSGSEGKDTGRPYNEGSGSHDMAQFNDTKEASMGRDSGLERSTSGSDSLPMDGTAASDEQGNGSGQGEAVSADLSNSNGQISKDIKPDDSTGSNSTGRGNLQAAELEEKLRTAHGSTEQLRNGTFVSELTKKEMKDVRSEVKKILENKKKGEEWTSSELALARLYEGGGGLKEKDATSNEILNAYYTPYKIIDAVWKLADSYAPNAVTVLEPSSGIGRFADNRLHNEFTLRELDEISSKLAKVLHPDATVISGAFQAQFFDATGRVKKENYELPKYDLVIGNPPYGENKNEWTGRGEGSEHTRYDQYFIEKALDSLKDENSVLAFVIPSGTLNSGVNRGKELIASKGVLVDAYRLPNNAFPTTQVGTDIVIFKKGAMDVNSLCSNSFFEKHPEKVLGEVSTRSGRFGDEYCVNIPEGETLDTLLTKIDSDIKNRGIDLEMIHENQIKNHLERIAEKNRNERNTAASKEKKKKSNIEKLLDEAKKDSLEVVHLYNAIGNGKVKVSKNPLSEIKNDRGRNIYGFSSSYDIETKKAFVTHRDELLATIDENGIVTNAFSKEDFKELSPGKREQVAEYISRATKETVFLNENLLGIHEGKYYLNNAGTRTAYMIHAKLFDSKSKVHLDDLELSNTLVPAITAEKSNLDDFSLSDFKLMNEDKGTSRLYKSRLFYPKFETIYPENGNFDFNALLDEISQNEMTIEDNIPVPDFRNTRYEEDEKNLALYREKISSLVLENSSVKSVDEYIQKLKEKNSEISEIRKNRTEKILSERNANQEAENLYGSLYSELSKMNFAKTMAEKFVGSYLVESRQDEKNPYQINVYIDQKRKFSVLQDSSKNVTLVSYNNERLPPSFVKTMYERFGERFSVSDVSPFEEKILSLDDIVKENQKKTASKALCEVAEKSLVEIFSDRELDSELNFEIENHKARIVQKGTHKQVFFDGSKYAALDFEKITQKLTVNNEVYNSGLQDFVSEKTSELNPDCKVKRDFTINGKRYIDSDGKTKLAPPKSPRYSPKQEELMTNKDFASLYGSKWNEDERIFFEVSDGFGGYINLNRLNEEQQKILRQSKNYVEEYPNKFIHREFYASGNIYKKIDKLEEDFSSGKVPLELYEKNLKILKKAVPDPVRNAEISILSSTVSDYEINGENIKESFLAWAVGRDIEGSGNTLDSIDDFSSSNVKREEIPSTINWKDVYDYVNGIELAKISGDELSERQKNKLRSQKMNDRKLCAEKLFSRFLNEGLSKDEQDRFWNQYNRINHAIRTPDWSKLPLYIEGMNKYRNGVEFKLYDQQIKGVSFLCNKGNGLLAYDVGVGKTAAGIVATVNQIQTGKAKRPLIIVPKTVISQWESDIHELFPDVQVNNLDNLSSRAIANFYDGKHGLNIPEGSITLVTKEALNNISFTESTRDEMLKDFQDLTGVSNEQFSKMSDKEREDYKNKLRDLFGQAEKIDSKDFVFFENCGFDNITVDEAQYYKNLFKVPRTKQANEFAGMGSGKPSKRAVKMFVISQQIQKQNDGRNVFLLSATPFTNSPSEIYSMLIYMARKEMEEQGIKNFYDFCAKHIKTQYEPVVKPNGEIEYANVIKSFNELDALQDSLLSQFIDKVDGEEAGIVRPNKHTLLSKMEATPLQKEIFNFCTNVLMEYDPKKDTNPDHDDEYKRHHSGMILEAINIMRTACLSPALVNAEKLVDPYTENHSGIVVPELDDVVECSPKLKLVCDTVVKNWKENHTHGQLIFMPQGTVAYPKVVEYMVKQGVPKEVFATVDGTTAKIGGKSVKMSKNDEENEQVRTVVAKAFNDRENPCKILIGSDAIKEGINLNGNSIAMYNCMLGWNPSDAIQAEGRVWRQGNRQGDVNIVYPLIYNSVDSLIYQKYDEKKSRIDALWEKSDGEDKKIDLAEINPADLKFDLIKDPVKRAKLELGGEKEKVRQEILNIRNSVLNFEGYVKKLEALTETLQSRRQQKADYIANYRNALFEGKETRTEEEQKKGIERYDASILKAENSIKAMQKKIDGELNKNGRIYTKETFKAEKQNEIEVLEEKVKTFDSPEVMQPIIDKYRIKLAEEAVLNLSAEEKNPLDKRIQEVLRPAYFTQWERKNERAELLIQGELDKIDELQKSLDTENESESRQEIKEIKQNIAHLRNENNEFRADWMHKYGTYDTALKFWNETHVEIEPEKEKKVLHNAKVEDIQKETVKDSPKIQTAEKLESAITPPNGEPAASEKKVEPKLTKAELQGYLFDIKPAEKAEIKAVEKQPVDISKTDSFTKIDFDFKEEKGFSFDYLKKCGLIPPCKPENNGMVKVMGEDKTEYLMTKRQVSHMVDNAVFHAKNHLQIDVAELSKSVPEYRKQFLNDTLMEVGQERMTILRNRQNENKTELNKNIEQNNVSVSRN